MYAHHKYFSNTGDSPWPAQNAIGITGVALNVKLAASRILPSHVAFEVERFHLIRGCPESVGLNRAWYSPLIQDDHGLSSFRTVRSHDLRRSRKFHLVLTDGEKN